MARIVADDHGCARAKKRSPGFRIYSFAPGESGLRQQFQRGRLATGLVYGPWFCNPGRQISENIEIRHAGFDHQYVGTFFRVTL